MSTVRALVWREAREQRIVFTVVLLSSLAAVCAFHAYAVVGNHVLDRAYFFGIVPVVGLVSTWILAIESLTRENENEVGERLQYLPLSRTQLVGSKVLWVTMAALILCLALVTVEATYLQFNRSEWTRVYRSTSHQSVQYWSRFGFLLTTWCVAFGLWFRRWLVAIAAMLVSAWGLFAWQETASLRVLPEVIPGEALFAIVVLVPFSFGLYGYRSGWLLPRERLFAGVRIIGCTGFVLTTLAVVLDRSTERLKSMVVAPGEALPYSGFLVRSDQYLLVQARSTYKPMIGVAAWQHSQWVLDVSTGLLVRDLTDVGLVQWDAHKDAEPGHLILTGRPNLQGVWDTDIQTGGTVKIAPSYMEFKRVREGRLKYRGGSDIQTMTYLDRKKELRIGRGTKVRLGNAPGIFYQVEGGVIIKHDLLEGTQAKIYPEDASKPEKISSLQASPDGQVLLVQMEGTQRYLAAHDGAVLADVTRNWDHSQWTLGPEPFAVASLVDEDLKGGSDQAAASLWIGPDGNREVSLPQGGTLRVASDGRKFLIGRDVMEIDDDGHVLRMLCEYKVQDE